MRALLFAAALIYPTTSMSDGLFDLKIGYAPGITFSSDTAQKVVKAMEDGFAKHCDRPAVTVKSVKEFPSGIPSTYSASTYAEAAPFAKSGFSFHVVSDITRCGEQSGVGILGCAYRRGPIVVKRQGSVDRYALLVAHEVGHAQGAIWSNQEYAEYNDGHNKGFSKLMYFAPWAWGMDSKECDTILGPQAFAAGGSSEEEDTERAFNAEEHLGQLLMAPWPEGLNAGIIEILEENRDAVIAESERMIESGEYEAWQNIATSIGYLQPENAEATLEQIIGTEPSGLDDTATFFINDAKENAVSGLGMLMKEGKLSDEARIYHLARPNYVIDTVRVGDVSEDERILRAMNISRKAIAGLALSGPEYVLRAIEVEKGRDTSQIPPLFDEMFIKNTLDDSRRAQSMSLRGIFIDGSDK